MGQPHRESPSGKCIEYSSYKQSAQTYSFRCKPVFNSRDWLLHLPDSQQCTTSIIMNY